MSNITETVIVNGYSYAVTKSVKKNIESLVSDFEGIKIVDCEAKVNQVAEALKGNGKDKDKLAAIKEVLEG